MSRTRCHGNPVAPERIRHYKPCRPLRPLCRFARLALALRTGTCGVCTCDAYPFPHRKGSGACGRPEVLESAWRRGREMESFRGKGRRSRSEREVRTMDVTNTTIECDFCGRERRCAMDDRYPASICETCAKQAYRAFSDLPSSSGDRVKPSGKST